MYPFISVGSVLAQDPLAPPLGIANAGAEVDCLCWILVTSVTGVCFLSEKAA